MKKKIILLIALLLLPPALFAQSGFSSILITDSTAGTQGIYVCDVDNDGDNDILSAAAEINKVMLWENDGSPDPQWTKHIVDNFLLGAGSVYAADLNGDSYLDIIAAGKGANKITWYKNSGTKPPTFTKDYVDLNYEFPHEVYAEDLDQDGDIDVLAVSSTDNLVTWWRNEGGDTISWTEQTIDSSFTQAKSIAVGDFDDNDTLDVVAASLLRNEIAWWKNLGGDPIVWEKHSIITYFDGAHRVQVIDLDQDGDDDILGAAWYGNQVAWFRNNGGSEPTFTKLIIQNNFTRTCMAYAEDLDNDGDYDVVGTSQDDNEVMLWWNDSLYNEKIYWTSQMIDPDFMRVWPVYAADLNGDSLVDIVAASGHVGNKTMKWYRNGEPNGIKESKQIPQTIDLKQNYPNPFNPSTSIIFTLPEAAEVQLTVTDIQGQTVAILIDEKLSAGVHQAVWNGNSDSGESAPSGIYFYSITYKNIRQTKKMVLLR